MSFEAKAPSISPGMTMLAIYPPQWVTDHATSHAQEDVINNGLHVTVVRLGQTDENEARLLLHVLRNAASLLEPIELAIEGAGFFNAQDLYVHWLLINGEGLEKWRSTFLDITDKMGLLPPQRFGYTPHMTLGYYAKEDGGLPKGWEESGTFKKKRRWLCGKVYLVRGTDQTEEIQIGAPPKSEFEW